MDFMGSEFLAFAVNFFTSKSRLTDSVSRPAISNVVYIDVKTKVPVLKFINTHQLFDLHKQVKKTCMNLTSPLSENELNGTVLDVNELIILSDFVFFFYLEPNNWRRYIIVILLQNVSKFFVSNLSKIHKKVTEINWSKNKFSKLFLSEMFSVNVDCLYFQSIKHTQLKIYAKQHLK